LAFLSTEDHIHQKLALLLKTKFTELASLTLASTASTVVPPETHIYGPATPIVSDG